MCGRSFESRESSLERVDGLLRDFTGQISQACFLSRVESSPQVGLDREAVPGLPGILAELGVSLTQRKVRGRLFGVGRNEEIA